MPEGTEEIVTPPTEPVVPTTPPPSPPIDRDVDKLPVWAQAIIRDLRQENADRRMKAKDAEEARAKEEGRYKELFEQRDKELADLRTNLAQEQRNKWALDAAIAAGIPTEFAARLRGSTEADLRQDAETLKALLPKRPVPNTEGGSGTGTGNGRTTQAQELERVRATMSASGRYSSF